VHPVALVLNISCERAAS